MRHVVALGMAALLGWSTQGCGNGQCEGAGRTYEDGTVWTCLDGCNECWCRDGEVTSTMAICTPPDTAAAGKYKCKEGGQFHKHGETWLCADACSECTCSDGLLKKDSSAC